MEMTAALEFLIQGEEVELMVFCEFDPDYPISIESCLIRQNKHEQCVFSVLTPAQMCSLEQQAIAHLHDLADRKEAMEEDAADTRAQIAREMQQEYLETADRQRGTRL